MNPKVERKLQKVKELDRMMLVKLEELRIAREEAANAKMKETAIFNEITEVERELGQAKDQLFEILRKE